jgi:hypothetical protein
LLCSWPGLEANVGLAHRHSTPFHFPLIQIEFPNRFQASKIPREVKQFEKNMNSILLFEFEYNI